MKDQMATIILSAVGTGSAARSAAQSAPLVGTARQSIIGGGSREGARLKELAVTTSSYGTPLARHYGRMRDPGA